MMTALRCSKLAHHLIMRMSSMILSLTEYNMDVYDSPELRAVDCNSVAHHSLWLDELDPEDYSYYLAYGYTP